MTPPGGGSFAGQARVASGSGTARTTQPYRVEVADGHLLLVLAATGRPVLRTPIGRTRARPLGRAGAVVVEVDDAPVLVDFTERGGLGTGPTHAVRRVTRAVRGRRIRRAFLAAARRVR